MVRSTPSSSRSTPFSGDEGVTVSTKDVQCERFSDVASWDELRQCYTVLSEVKSSETQALEVQCTEQMFGAFRPHQKAMLGLGIKPISLGVKILRRRRLGLELNTLEYDMALLQDGNLAKLIIAFY